MDITMAQKTFFHPSGHLNEYGISLTVDAFRLDRPGALPTTLTNHVEQCDECKQQIMQIVDQMKDLPVNAAEPHPYFDSVQTSSVRWYRAAAIIILFLAGGTILYLSQNHRGAEQPGYAQEQTVPETTSIPPIAPPHENPPQQFADNFIPSPNLDNVITSEFRSSSFKVLSPGIGETVKSPVMFRWNSIGRPVTLKILSNTETTILTSTVNDSIFITSKKIVPGVYYWKLEENDELLYLGKFVIR
jgi:hypothetical protein